MGKFADNSPSAKFCEDCGASLGTPRAATSAKKSDDLQIRVAETSSFENPEGERKTVTALFADIKGSMDLMEDLDPEEARAIVDPVWGSSLRPQAKCNRTHQNLAHVDGESLLRRTEWRIFQLACLR